MTSFLFSQNENTKWYFGYNAGLDFMTDPPTVLTNGAMSNQEGSACVSNNAGNILFYTDGSTIWNSNHAVMANGTGLNGHTSTTQSALIIKKPGSNSLYYVFTMPQQFSNPYCYSIVDLSLAAGLGSVTVKNYTMHPIPYYTTEKLTGTRHCNGTDFWIVTHMSGPPQAPNIFKSYSLTATGVSTNAVVSSTVGTTIDARIGQLKISPDGKKIALANTGDLRFALFDFDNATGVVSNQVLLLTNVQGPYGIEFSPDGSKLYGARLSANSGQVLYQWDLCAGSGSAIAASLYTMAAPAFTLPNLGMLGSLQLAPNGKIYLGRTNVQSLGVINNPNVYGSGCNFVGNGQSVAPKSAHIGLPNYITSFEKSPPAPFTYSVSNVPACYGATYTPPPLCQIGYSVTGMLWNFGDPASGVNNTSTLFNPVHAYSSQGSYTTQLLIYYTYPCGGGGTDTLNQLVNISLFCPGMITVSASAISCANLGSATVTSVSGIGPYSYTWMPGAQSGSVATGLSPGNYSVTVFDIGANVTYSSLAQFTSAVSFTGSVTATALLKCFGVSDGTASVVNILGGSGNQNYLWTNGINTQTTSVASGLGTGQWSVTVTDALSGCMFQQSFAITQPPALTLNVSAASPSACIAASVLLTGNCSGGTPGYNYQWIGGAPTNSNVVSELVAGTYVYTLNSVDSNTCTVSNTVAIDFIPKPVLVVSSVSICPLSAGTLTVSGATSYTWSNSSNNNFLVDNPLVNTNYTVVGEALNCLTTATASINLFPIPPAIINHNAPVCDGQTFGLTGFGGTAFSWFGPSGFGSTSQFVSINPATSSHAGVYNLTVTSVHGCTASTSATINIIPTPTLSATGATVCTSQTLNLSANAAIGSVYQWTGPNGFSSGLQNPSINSPLLSSSGNYFVKVTSVAGCTNMAVVNAGVVPPPSLTLTLSSPTLCFQAFNGSPNTITLTSGGASSYTLFTPNLIGTGGAIGSSTSLTPLPPYSTSLSIGTATLEGSNGVCSSSTTVLFTVVPNPTVGINSYTPIICAGQNFTYTSSGANSYTWGPNSLGLTSYTSPVTVADPTTTVVYSVYGGSLGCNSPTKTSTLTVYPLPEIMITAAPPAICLYEKTILTAGGTGTSFQWFPSTGLNDIVGASVIASPLTTRNYSVIASAHNCTNMANITVTVLPLPQPTINATKTSVCVNEFVFLKGSGGIRCDWYGPVNIHYQGNEVSFIASSLHWSGIYTLTVTDDNGCKNSTTKNLVVNNLPEGSLIGNKINGCAPLCDKYFFSPSDGAASINSVWQIGNHVFNDNFSYCFYEAGTFTITGRLTDAETGCKNSVSYNVIVHPKPEADFQYAPLEPIENLDEVIFTNTSSGESQTKWNWFFNDNKGFKSESIHTSYLYENSGVFPVAMIVTNQWNCKDSVVKTVKVGPDFSVFVPNTFTPNGDDKNEIFMPVMRGVKLYDLQIFNRWGDMIFASSEPQVGWDGSYKNIPCKVDVYIWKITLSGLNGEKKKMNGHVMLLR